MAEKKPYEIAIDEFEEADEAYKTAESYITSGDALVELAAAYSNDPDTMRTQWFVLWEQLRTKLDERNTKYTAAANELRKAVVPDISQGQKWRGPVGAPTRLNYGKLEVCTRTRRFFKGNELYQLAERYGLIPELEKLTYIDEKTGQRENVMETVVQVEFKHMLQWLQDHDHGGTKENPTVYRRLLNGSYDEKEDTPAVSGSKRIAFLGQYVDK